MKNLLKLLEKDARLTTEQLAAMLDKTDEEIEAAIAQCEEDNTILGYTALIDWDKVRHDDVTALIEVKISPQRGDGFDRIAERIYQYDEVENLYLMSGAFDLAVFIKGRSLQEIAHFVFAHLAPLDGVTSTSTHFILKKYKEKYRTFGTLPEQKDKLRYV